MKNYNPYTGDAFKFFQKVCKNKDDVDLKNRLQLTEPEIKILFDNYDKQFHANNLESLIPKGYTGTVKADLKELYLYKSAAFRGLKKKLTTTATGRVVKCQNCTINDVNTFDHFVPQSEFIEYTTHPLNLICSCGDCNPRKSKFWRDTKNKRTALNLYLDQLPNVQYLFVQTDVGNLSIDVEFKLINKNGVDADLYKLLEDHYTNLGLFERFKDATDTVITSFRNTLEPMKDFKDPITLKQVVQKTLDLEKASFGVNYWQAVLKEALLNDDDFMIDFL